MHKRYCYFIMGDECGLLGVRHLQEDFSPLRCSQYRAKGAETCMIISWGLIS
jgi:hypothetical protein